VTDRGSRTQDPWLARKVVYRVWELGAVVDYVGSSVLEVTLPLIITDAEIDLAAELLATAFRDAVAAPSPTGRWPRLPAGDAGRRREPDRRPEDSRGRSTPRPLERGFSVPSAVLSPADR
jgi:hypothetical protein